MIIAVDAHMIGFIAFFVQPDMERKFVFGNFDKWLPPMLAGGDVAEMKALSRVVQKAWGSFAQNGTPNDKTLIEWPPFENDRKLKLIWNRYIEVTGS